MTESNRNSSEENNARTRKLYIVEGLPGSGKTTFAQKLSSALQQRINANQVHLYVEGDLHPADMAWCALLTRAELEALCLTYPALSAQIRHNATQWEDRFILAYTKISQLPDELYLFLESKEIYDHRVGVDEFCRIHLNRWETFGQNASGIIVFECVLLQNAVNELLLFHMASEKAIMDYVHGLLGAVSCLNPEIIYLDMNPADSISCAAAERVDEHGKRVWEERVAEYICASPFGKAMGYHGTAGMLDYFIFRQALEKTVIASLNVRKHIVPLSPEHQEEQVQKWIHGLLAS